MLEKVAYAILIVLALAWITAIVVGMIAAFPFGLIGLIGLLAIGLLTIKVFVERIGNEEDDYYDRTVEK